MLVLLFFISASAVFVTPPVHSCHRCSDGECSPRVCRYPGNCDYSCMDCRSDANCGWASGRPYCSGNSCVQCTSVGHCASNNNCDVSCDSGKCNVHSSLDCTSQKGTPYCVIGSSKCVECLDNSHCGGSKPYCSSSNTCEECLNNFHCRNITHCNALCEVGNTGSPGFGATCQHPIEQEFLECSDTEVCYEWLGQCHDKCFPSGNQSGCPPLNSTVDGDQCNPNDGKCYLCISDFQCNTSTNQTCGAVCQLNSDHQHQCTSGTTCTLTQNCKLKLNGNGFQCSFASILQINVVFLVFLVLLIVVLF